MNIFDFSNFREFIKYRLSLDLYGQTGHKKSNLSRVAKDLGYSSPSLLSMVLSGRRLPSEDLCEALVQNWKLNLKEKEYFRLLVQLEKKNRQGQDLTPTIEQLRKVTGARPARHMKDQEFFMIKDWFCLVVKQLVQSPHFQEDPNWISQTLRRKITPAQAQKALTLLIELGMVERNPETLKLQVVARDTETSQDIPSVAIRQHHLGMIQRASEAIEEQTVDERFFNSLTLNFNPNEMVEIKKQFIGFFDMINSTYGNSNAPQIYQMNLQFFEHTAGPKKTSNKIQKKELEHEDEK